MRYLLSQFSSFTIGAIIRNPRAPMTWLTVLGEPVHPRPIKGILEAITVMNCTLASKGRLAM